MPRLIVTAEAVRGLERCRRFLSEKDPRSSERASEAIGRHLRLLADMPEIGRPDEEHPELRELLIHFGDSGYVGLYHFDRTNDAVLLLAFRHMKEAGY